MNRPLKASLIAVSIAALPFSAGAAGLGRLNVMSALGQPLRAEVELTASPQELQSLTARLASQEAFRQANVAYAPVLAGVNLAVERRGGRVFVRLSSDRPINAPFIDLLIELDWGAGQLVREYTFLLDPPETMGAKPVAESVVPVAVPASPSRPQPRQPVGGEAADGATYQVKRGDTLRGIAETTRGEGVSLDQMLVALFRGNKGAFDADNINRLKAGKILTIPSAAAAQAIAPAEARREVQAHSSDFQSYRQALAGSVATRPAGEGVARQESAGRITPKVAEPAAPATPQDQVKVSTGEAGKAPAGSKSPAGDATARLQALEEDIVSRDKALKEANARLSELEQSIQELQKLIELKSQSMAKAEQQAGSATPAAPVAEEPAAPVAAPEPAPAAKPPAPAKPAPAALPKEEPGFLASLLADPKMLAGGGGVLALLLGYLGYKRRKGRQTPTPAAEPTTQPSAASSGTNSVFGAAGGQSVDTGNSSMLQTDFSQSGLSAIDADEGVDPVAEADVYMAYGRDAQAEEILIDALKVDPHRGAVYVKLLEIYAHRKNLKQFESLATDFYALTGGQGPDWVKAAAIGRKLDPDNPLYNEPGEAVAVPEETPTQLPGLAEEVVAVPELPGEEKSSLEQVEPPATETPPLEFIQAETSSQMKETWALPGELKEFAEPLEASGGPELDQVGGLDFNLDLDEPAAPGAEPLPGAEAPDVGVGDLEFSLDLEPESAGSSVRENGSEQALVSTQIDGDSFRLDLDGEPLESAADFSSLDEPEVDLAATTLADAGVALQESPEVDLEQSSLATDLLDFDFDLEAAEPAQGGAAPAPLDLSEINLELDGTETTLESVGEPLEAAPSDSEEAETKLELAKAYEEMGDRDGARELLEEVLKEGSAGQQESARTMLARLA